MIFSIIIQTSAQKSEIAFTALQFAQTLLSSQHQIYRVFLYGDGVSLAGECNVFPQDEIDIHSAWRTFIATHKIDAVVCIAAGLRRGILNTGESIRYQKSAVTLSPEYELSGLGQLIDAAVHSDKLITFA
jgi:tRNA 2-thiouridine synthesizing protein D